MATVSAGTLNVLVYCYFGNMATESYANMSDCLFNLNWHELPLKLQKYLIVMATNMQRPLYYHGFGVLYLNLPTFTSVRLTILHITSFKWIKQSNCNDYKTSFKFFPAVASSVFILHGN